MYLDYESLTVVILVNTFGLMLVVVGKDVTINIIVLALLTEGIVLLLLLVITISYCESGSVNIPNSSTYYFNDPLWGGAGCVDHCCDDTTQPCFYRQLNQITQDNIEVQLYVGYSFATHGSTLIDQLELYIQ